MIQTAQDISTVLQSGENQYGFYAQTYAEEIAAKAAHGAHSEQGSLYCGKYLERKRFGGGL